jgi:hypothetical protein
MSLRLFGPSSFPTQKPLFRSLHAQYNYFPDKAFGLIDKNTKEQKLA